MTTRPRLLDSLKRQTGAAAVEFALTSIIWIGMTIGIVEMGRAMYIWSALHEAVRIGARNAAVCATSNTATLASMQAMLPLVNASTANVVINYPVTPCTAASCLPLTVTITGVDFVPMMVPLQFTFPEIQASLPVETRSSAGQATNCDL